MQENIDLRQLRYFVSVAKERSFSRAALREFVSQPAISMGIRALEDALQTPLFFRQPGQAQLTAAGLSLYDYAQTVLELHTEAIQEIRAQHSRKVDHLRLGISPFVDPFLLEITSRTYHELFPASGLEPACAPTGQLLDELTTGRIDAALIMLPCPDRSLTSFEIAREPLVVCLRSSDPLAAQTSISPQQLHARLTIFRDPDRHPAGHRRLVEMLHHVGIKPRVHACAASPEEVIILVRAGVGCALIQESMALPDDLTARSLEGVDWTAGSAFAYSPARRQKEIPLWAKRLKRRLHPPTRS
jgi:DNA-binding transcriptional LysR family regulator